MNKRGFSIVETMVVVAIVAILSVFSIENIVRFQKNTLLDSASSEFKSLLESARSKSIAGEAVNGADITFFEEGYLPEFGVNVSPTAATLFGKYRKAGEGTDTRDNGEVLNVTNGITLTPGETVFARRNGDVSGASSYTLVLSGAGSRQVDITSGGAITISRL